MAELLRYNPAKHQVIHPPLEQWLAREFADREMFVYFHRYHKSYVVAEWRSGGHVKEWLVIGTSLDAFDREKATDLRWRITSADQIHKAIRAGTISVERAQRRYALDEQEEFTDCHRVLRRNIHSHVKRDDAYLRAAAGLLD